MLLALANYRPRLIANCEMHSTIEKSQCLTDANSSIHTAASRRPHIVYFVRSVCLIIPAKAREYVFTGVGLYVYVCLSVCNHDN